MDVKTILLCIALINIFLCVALFAAWRTQKVYPGFGFWVLSNLALVLGIFVMILLRGIFPLIVTGIANSLIFMFAAWLRLWGLYYFFGEKRKMAPHFMGMCLVFVVLLYFPDPAARTAVISSVLGFYFFWMTQVIISHIQTEVRMLYRFAGSFFFIYGGLLVYHAVIAVVAPSQIMIPRASIANVLYYLATMLLDIGMTFVFIMMNTKRMTIELQEALAQIRILRGILPICSSCKKIRDDTGYWQQVEQYVSAHTDAQFSHGICPECAARLYPDIDLSENDGITEGSTFND